MKAMKEYKGSRRSRSAGCFEDSPAADSNQPDLEGRDLSAGGKTGRVLKFF